MDESGSTIPIVFNNCISVKAAAVHSGYSLQYIRQLLRLEKLDGLKLGQQWLIKIESFETFLENTVSSKDNRFSPQ